MAWSMFIASSKFLLKVPSVVLGLSKMYRELVVFAAGVASCKSSFLVISGISVSICISVHIISSEEQSDGSVSGIGFWLFCGVTIGWSWPLTSAVVSSTCATRQGTEVSAICVMGIASPSLAASALFLGLDDRRISGDFCSCVAFMSIRFAPVYQVMVFSHLRLCLTKVKWTCRIRIELLIGQLSVFSADSFFQMALGVVEVWRFSFVALRVGRTLICCWTYWTAFVVLRLFCLAFVAVRQSWIEWYFTKLQTCLEKNWFVKLGVTRLINARCVEAYLKDEKLYFIIEKTNFGYFI